MRFNGENTPANTIYSLIYLADGNVVTELENGTITVWDRDLN